MMSRASILWRSLPAFFLLVSFPIFVAPDTPIQIQLAAGAEGGNYIRLARTIQRRAAEHNLSITVITTGGSVENVELLSAKRADIGFVQSDISQRAVRGHKPFPKSVTNLRLVTPLFTEAVQILVRSDLFVFSTEELRGKIVSFGPKGSGTEETARSILEASGVSVKEVDENDVAIDETEEKLQDEAVDAAFLTSAVPTPAVARALQKQNARLLLLGGQIIERLVKSGSYVNAVIPRGTYDNQPDDVPTVGVESLLIVREDCEPKTVSTLLQILRLDQKEIEHDSGVRMDLLGTSGPPNSLVPTHSEAMGYLRTANRSWFFFLILGGALSAFLGFIFWYHRSIRRSLAVRKEVVSALLVLIAVWISGSGGLFYFERHVNENFESFQRSMWSVVVYVAGGFQIHRPITSGGEIVAVLAIVFGVGVVAWFIAELASHFVKGKFEFLEQLLVGRNRVPETMKDHIVIVNWDNRSEFMIRQLHGPDIVEKRPVVMISSVPVLFPVGPAFHNCFAVVGEATDVECLKHAGVSRAHSVTILSSWRNPDPNERRQVPDADVADGKTVLTLLAIRTQCSGVPNSDCIHVTAEIRSSKNLSVAEAAGRGGPTEVVCVERFGAEMLTQCALTPGLAAVYEDLLTLAPETDEIYKIPVPRSCFNKTFSQALSQFALNRRNKSHAAIPIAVCRGSRVRLNPPDDDPFFPVLLEGDYLFVIADNETVQL